MSRYSNPLFQAPWSMTGVGNGHWTGPRLGYGGWRRVRIPARWRRQRRFARNGSSQAQGQAMDAFQASLDDPRGKSRPAFHLLFTEKRSG